MFGYIALVIGILIISLLTLGMSRAISTGSLARNEAIGIRTKATLSSDDAWENGHKAALPFLSMATVTGAIGAVFALLALPFFSSAGEITDPGIFSIPVVAFTVQIVIMLAACVKANQHAKAAIS